jgi:hypothetical protein
MTRTEALNYRKALDSVISGLDGESADAVKVLYPEWQPEGHYSVGDKRLYKGVLYRCLQEHDAQEGWNPVDAPSLWAKVLNPDPEVIPVWEQPDATNPYMKGDKVHYPTKDDPIYESLIDNNVWSPEAYPAGWQVLLAETE